MRKKNQNPPLPVKNPLPGGKGNGNELIWEYPPVPGGGDSQKNPPGTGGGGLTEKSPYRGGIYPFLKYPAG